MSRDNALAFSYLKMLVGLTLKPKKPELESLRPAQCDLGNLPAVLRIEDPRTMPIVPGGRRTDRIFSARLGLEMAKCRSKVSKHMGTHIRLICKHVLICKKSHCEEVSWTCQQARNLEVIPQISWI